jgi:hypothetical protein
MPLPAQHAELVLDFQHTSTADGLALIADTLHIVEHDRGIDADIELPMDRTRFVISFRGLKHDHP